MLVSNKNKLMNRPFAAYLMVDKLVTPANTTLASPALAGATTVTLTSATGFTAGKPFRIGAGEWAEPCIQSGAPAGAVVTLSRPLRRDHEALEPVVECTVFDLGALSGAAGLTIRGETTRVAQEQNRLTYATLNGYQDIEAFLTMIGVTPYTFAVGLGIPLVNVRGVGTQADPFELTTDGGEIGSAVNQFIVVHGITNDGQPFVLELWGAETDYTGFSVPLARGTASVVPGKWIGAYGFAETNAPIYVGDATIKPGKADLLDAVNNIGAFEAATTGPLSTTLSAPAAAGQKNITMTSSTNLVAQDWVEIGSGASVEYHRVQTLGTPNVLATRLYRAHPAGTPVVRCKKVPFGGIVKGSVKFDVGGSVEKIQFENARTTQGLKAGDANPVLSFTLAASTLENLARAAGIPQSAITSGRLDLYELIATTSIRGLYLEGKNQAQQTVVLGLWGCSQAISELPLTMQRTGGIGGFPFAVEPGSAFTILVHA